MNTTRRSFLGILGAAIAFPGQLLRSSNVRADLSLGLEGISDEFAVFTRYDDGSTSCKLLGNERPQLVYLPDRKWTYCTLEMDGMRSYVRFRWTGESEIALDLVIYESAHPRP